MGRGLCGGASIRIARTGVRILTLIRHSHAPCCRSPLGRIVLRLDIRHGCGCNARPPDEVPDAAAYIEVRDDLLAATAPLAFRGWMLANAPAAHMLEHPVYDLRILDCR